MSNEAFISYYEEKTVADNYHAHRINYPPFLAEEIVNYLKANGGNSPEKFDFMLDVGCGSGQATQIFAPYFKDILGIDISFQQLEVARKHIKEGNISFQHVNDNDLPVESNSVDYVNCATTAHWLDLDHFVSECKRVLRPRGVAALYCYSMESIQVESRDPASNQAELDGQYHQILHNFVQSFNGHPRNNHWLERYESLFDQIKNPTKSWLKVSPFYTKWKLIRWRHWWTSKGDYVEFMKEKKPQVDPLDDFMEKTKRFLKVDGKEEDITIKMKWEVPTIVFRKSV